MYDWANSAFQCTIITAVFPIYFASVAADGLPPAVATERFATATTLAHRSSSRSWRRSWARTPTTRRARSGCSASSSAIGVIATAAMYLHRAEASGSSPRCCSSIANIGVSASFVFYDSLLPHIAGADEMDRVSSAGYALGYLGGGLLLAINLAWILKPGMVRARRTRAWRRACRSSASRSGGWSSRSRCSAACPSQPSRPATNVPRRQPGRRVVRQLGVTLRELRRYRQAFLMLVAFLIYNDGIGTIIRMAAPYGKEIGLPTRTR